MSDNRAEIERIGGLLSAGRLVEAEVAARRLVQRHPRDMNACSLLGFVLLRANKPAEAEYFVRRTATAFSDKPRAQANLGKTLWLLGRMDEALAVLRPASGRWPSDPDVGEALAELLLTRQRPREALLVADEVLATHRDNAQVCAVRGRALQRLGRIEEALVTLRRAVERAPERGDLLESLAFMQQYDPDVTPAGLCNAHRRWGAWLAARTPTLPEVPVPALGARLRIGIVSPDFRRHAVACFIGSFLEHAPKHADLFCYSVGLVEDEVTARLKALGASWRQVPRLDDAELAKRIRADRVGVLIDVAGHTSGDRLRLFAMRPAPVQVTYVGYAGTTGLGRIDYRIIDEVTDPPGTEPGSVETLVRMPTPHHCYRPYEEPPPVTPAPCSKNGFVTFGCFGGVIKMNRPLISLWARVLTAIPTARLLVKHGGSNEPEAIELLKEQLCGGGIDPERLSVVPFAPTHRAHLEAYSMCDMAFDTFPFTGATTTCEALLMGVPVVTRMGQTHASRMAGSMLTGLGRTEWIARDESEYVEIARGMAADLPGLAKIREGLRDELSRSALMDGHGHTTRMLEAIRRCLALAGRQAA